MDKTQEAINKENTNHQKSDIPNNLGLNKKDPQTDKNISFWSSFFYVIIDNLYGQSLKYSNAYDDAQETDKNIIPYKDLDNKSQLIFEYKNGDILNIDPYFTKILKDEKFTENFVANKEKLKAFINNHKSYKIDAIINTLINFILFIIFLTLKIYILLNEYYCKKTEIESKEKQYWECSDYKKCQVKEYNKLYLIFIVIYYTVFHLFFYIYKIIMITNLECNLIRKLQTRTKIIIYKSFEYLYLLGIITFDFIENPKCYNYDDDKILFIIIKKYSRHLVISIIELIIKIYKK